MMYGLDRLTSRSCYPRGVGRYPFPALGSDVAAKPIAKGKIDDTCQSILIRRQCGLV